MRFMRPQGSWKRTNKRHTRDPKVVRVQVVSNVLLFCFITVNIIKLLCPRPVHDEGNFANEGRKTYRLFTMKGDCTDDQALFIKQFNKSSCFGLKKNMIV